MKPLLLALVLSGAITERSLDIGLDVLPEAFTFAAQRVGFSPNLRLARCTPADCFWDLGQGVELAATHREDEIAISRVEAKLRADPTMAPDTLRRYENACLTIVALVYREGAAAEKNATAKAIAASSGPEPGVQLELPERNIRFYGTRATSMTQSKRDIVLRCGATARS